MISGLTVRDVADSLTASGVNRSLVREAILFRLVTFGLVTFRNPNMSFPCNAAESVSWRPDGTRLVTGWTPKGKMSVFDTQTGREVWCVESPEDFGSFQGRTAWSPDGALVATGTPYGSVHFLDAASGAVTKKYDTDNAEPVRSVAWSPDGSKIATAAANHARSSIGVWDATSNLDTVFNLRLNTYERGIAIAWNTNGTKVGCVTFNGTAIIVDVAAGTHETRPCPFRIIKSAAWNSDLTKCALVSLEGSVRILDIATGNFTAVHFARNIQTAIEAHYIAWGPDDSMIAIGMLFGSGVRLYDVADSEYCGIRNTKFPVLDVRWSPCGSKLAYVEEGGIVHVWNTSSAIEI